MFEATIYLDYASRNSYAVVPVFPKSGTAFATQYGLDPNIPFCAVVNKRDIAEESLYSLPMVGEYFGRSPIIFDNNFP